MTQNGRNQPLLSYRVSVRGAVPGTLAPDLGRKLAEAHAMAVKNRSVKAVDQVRTRVLSGWDDSDATEDGLEIDSKAMDGGAQA